MMSMGRGISSVSIGNSLGMMGGVGLSPATGLLQYMQDIMDDFLPGMRPDVSGNYDPIAASVAGLMPMAASVGFTLVNGQVTGMQQQIGPFMFNMGLPRNAAFNVGGDGTVTETLSYGAATTMMSYAPNGNGATGYHLMSEIVNFANPAASLGGNRISGYAFTISNGVVTGMQEAWGTAANPYTLNLPLPPTATLSLSGTTVTETLVLGNTVETRSFVPSGTGGLYTLASDAKSFVQPGAATTALSVNPYDRDKFTLDASGHVTQVQAVRADGSLATLTPGSATGYSQIAPGYVLETVGSGAYGHYAVYRDGNGDGIYTAVAHGIGTSVDLVGLQSQITHAIDIVL